MVRTLRLELARCHEFPEGSASHGYEMRVPLTPAATIDHDAWKQHRRDCSFRRFWGDDEVRGELRHRGQGWVLSAALDNDKDEAIVHADHHRFAVGEYVSIRDRDGIVRTFRVADVR